MNDLREASGGRSGSACPLKRVTYYEDGDFCLRPMDTSRDISCVYDWATRDYAKYWQMQNFSEAEVRAFYSDLIQSGYATALMGFYKDAPSFLLELYRAEEDIVGQYYPAEEGDYGFHILVGPAEKPVSGFTRAVFVLIMDFMFAHSAVDRLVVEPDVRNEKIHKLNKYVGFEYHSVIELPNKKAHLAFCTREKYKAMKEKINASQEKRTL